MGWGALGAGVSQHLRGYFGRCSWPAAHPCALGLLPQVQERCDYDLVTPLALLFYSAVLYVSAEAAAPPQPGAGPESGWLWLEHPSLLSSVHPRKKESVGTHRDQDQATIAQVERNGKMKRWEEQEKEKRQRKVLVLLDINTFAAR